MSQHVSPQHATPVNANINATHLYSTVVKPSSHHANGSLEHANTNGGATINGAASHSSSNGSNYASLLSTSSGGGGGGFNPSASHPNIASSNNIGLPSVPSMVHHQLNHHHNHHQSSMMMVNSYSANLRSKDTFAANPYRSGNNTTTTTTTTNGGSVAPSGGVPMNHYNNVDPGDRLLSAAGVYNAAQSQQHNRYKTNSLGGGSSSSGVISNGGSSPGHSPVGSVSGQAAAATAAGTHV